MPKTPSIKLFQLIKGLSGSEKRYFKLFVNNNGSGDKKNKYIQLFDANDNQEEFDDEVLKNNIYRDEPIESRKYSELKAYLYELIVKSLQSYDEKSSIDYKIKGYLQGVRALFKRAKFADCKDLLQKAKKLAYRYEAFTAILEIIDWEKQIAYAQADIDFLDKNLGVIQKEEDDCMEKLRNLATCKTLFLQLLTIVRKKALVDAKQREKVTLWFEEPPLSDEQYALSFKAKIFYYRVHSVYHFTAGNFQQFYEFGTQLITLIESKPHFLKEDASEYISALSNHCISCGMLNKYEEVEEAINKLNEIKPNTLDDQLKIHRQYYTIKFRLCIIRGAFEEGLKALEKHHKEVVKFDKALFERSSFYFQYFYIYFGVGNFSEALKYLNEWLNLPRTIERQDLQSIARVLNLIIHYEMGNTILLDSLLRSTYRFLSKRSQQYTFERMMVGFFQKVNKLHGRKEVKQAFIELQKDLKKIEQDRTQKIMLQLFEIEAWLESKIKNKTFGEVIKENFLRSASPEKAS